jgi:hypothetical protein
MMYHMVLLKITYSINVPLYSFANDSAVLHRLNFLSMTFFKDLYDSSTFLLSFSRLFITIILILLRNISLYTFRNFRDNNYRENLRQRQRMQINEYDNRFHINMFTMF